jgi:hypothetical protein
VLQVPHTEPLAIRLIARQGAVMSCKAVASLKSGLDAADRNCKHVPDCKPTFSQAAHPMPTAVQPALGLALLLNHCVADVPSCTGGLVNEDTW